MGWKWPGSLSAFPKPKSFDQLWVLCLFAFCGFAGDFAPFSFLCIFPFFVVSLFFVHSLFSNHFAEDVHLLASVWEDKEWYWLWWGDTILCLGEVWSWINWSDCSLPSTCLFIVWNKIIFFFCFKLNKDSVLKLWWVVVQRFVRQFLWVQIIKFWFLLLIDLNNCCILTLDGLGKIKQHSEEFSEGWPFFRICFPALQHQFIQFIGTVVRFGKSLSSQDSIRNIGIVLFNPRHLKEEEGEKNNSELWKKGMSSSFLTCSMFEDFPHAHTEAEHITLRSNPRLL